MPISVSMHACSVWPVTIDFTTFNFFLKGYSVEETVEQLMALQNVASENIHTKRRTSSASSSASPASTASSASASERSPHSPVHSAESSSPFSGALRPTHLRDSTEKKLDTPSTTVGVTAKNNSHTGDGELLTEDKRVSTEEEPSEELALPPASPQEATNVPTHVSDSAEPHTPSAPAPAITAVNTSTNVARPPHTAAPPAYSRHPHTSGHESNQLPKASPSHHGHRHHPHGHRHRNATHESTVHHNHRSGTTKKLHPTSATHSSSAQHTTTAFATNTAATSFARSSLWGNDGSSANLHSSRGIPFLEDFATATDGPAARGTSGSYNNNITMTNTATTTITTTGDGKNSSSEKHRAARQKKRNERQGFFLNEDYIKFQRQLQETEAIGAVGMGASSLQSRFLFEEVTEQFQTFRELAREEQLGSPYAFLSNYYLPIPITARLELLQMYYETDPGLFRWTFGDKLNRFDLPVAIAAIREEYRNGNLPYNNSNKLLFGTGGGGGSIAVNVSNSRERSFWPGRWKSSPGKLATMDAATLVRLSEQHTEALSRQWENIKHVCVTVAALYRGKGGMCVPLDMKLLTTIQQCFGLRHEQALNYATAAFGYEHHLETRLFDRLQTFSEYGTICTIVASVWCDDSGYFLSEPFRAGCRRVGRLLDEYRLLSELHPFIFGEPMRPRWQVQLDEVQRAITTSSLVDKNTVASATAVATAGSPVTAGSSSAGVSAVESNSNANVSGGSHSGLACSGGHNTGLNSSGSGGGGRGYGTDGVEGSGASLNAATTTTNTNVHSPFSGNGQYSRRFLMEFPSLMKHLLRICGALGNNGGVNDALDIFFTRVYSYLELLSSRSAPAIVSMVMNATASGGAAAPHAPSGAVGRPPLPPHVGRAHSHADLGHADAGREVRASPTPPALQSKSGPASPVRANTANNTPTLSKSMSTPSFSCVVQSDRRVQPAVDTPPFSASPEDVLVAGSAIPFAASTVVNTSLFHPASALFPLSTAVAAHNAPNTAGSFASSPLMTMPSGRSFNTEDEPPEWGAAAAEATHHSGSPSNQGAATSATAGGHRPVSPSGASLGGSANSLLTSQVGEMVRKVIDKRYLRELCVLLAALPKAWRQLTMLTTEDHAATDKTMNDLAMALKAITQVLMASDDFH